MLHILNVSNYHALDLGGVYHWHAPERIRVSALSRSTGAG
jgi:hypothetical protein